MADANNADGVRPERPWASPRQEPTKGQVQPRVIAPFGKPVRHTNILDYILHTTLKEASRHKHVWPFLKPVDAIQLGIPNYHEKIQRPMDLKTIESRIKNIYYTSFNECVEDIETVFQNCYNFNGPEDDVTIMAQNVHAVIKKSLENAPNEEVDQETTWGKKKKPAKESNRLAAGAEDRKKKEGSALRMSEPPSECGSDTSSVLTSGEKVNSSKLAMKTMKSGSKRKVESDDEEKPEPVRPAKREATSKKAQVVPVTGRMKFCQKLLNDFFSKKYSEFSWPFHKAVNAEELGLHDYHKIIKHPMDMSLIKKKLETAEYTDPSEFEADFRLMLNNCLLYNPVGDPIHNMGEQFLQHFEQRWKELPSEKGATSNSSSSASARHPPVPSTPVAPSSKSSSKSSSSAVAASIPVIKQEIKSSPPSSNEGSKARSEDVMRLENALALIQEREQALKTSLRQVEEMKSKVMKYRNSSRDKLPESLLNQVRTICQTTSSNHPLAGAKQITEQSSRTNGREVKKIIGYDFDSDCEEARDDMSYDDKRQLSMLINKLNPEHLATIVQIIERRESNFQLGSRNQEDSEIEIDFEALGPTCLREMNAFARYILKLPPASASSSSNSANPPAPATPSGPSSLPLNNASTSSLSAQNVAMAASLSARSAPLPNSSPMVKTEPEVKSPEKMPMKETNSNTEKKTRRRRRRPPQNQPPNVELIEKIEKEIDEINTCIIKSTSGRAFLNNRPSVLMRRFSDGKKPEDEERKTRDGAKKEQQGVESMDELEMYEKEKSGFNISESSDSDPSRKRRKPSSKNTDNSDTGSSTSSSDDDSEDDYRDMEQNRKGGIPPYSQGSSSGTSSSNHHPGPRLGGMGGQPPMARVPPPLPPSSHQRSSQQVIKKKSTSSTPIHQQSTSAANAAKTILDDLLPTGSSGGGHQKKIDVVEEDDEERIERLRREAKLARQREDENSLGMSNQMEMMTAFEFEHMY